MRQHQTLIEDIKATARCSAGCMAFHAAVILVAVAGLEALVT